MKTALDEMFEREITLDEYEWLTTTREIHWRIRARLINKYRKENPLPTFDRKVLGMFRSGPVPRSMVVR